MYRLLVVDDEPMIAEGLCNIIEENNIWGLELYGTFLGADALRILRETRIDIVMTDIRMPALSGIDLLRVIRSEWPQCKIIFLTAHEEFDYAYTALKDSGARFLLKAEGHDAILKIIGDCVNEIEAELQAEELRIQAGQQKNTILALRRNDFFREILNGVCTQPSREDFDALGLGFNPGTGAYILVSDFLRHGREAYGQAEVIRELLVNLTDGRILCEICVIEKNTAVWIIQRKADDALPDILNILVDRLEAIQGLHSGTASFVLSGAAYAWDMLAAGYKRLKSLLGIRLTTESGFVFTDASGSTPGADNAYLRMADECKKDIELLSACLETGSLEMFLQKLNAVCAAMQELFNGHAGFGRETAMQLNLFFLLCKNRIQAPLSKAFDCLSENDISFPFPKSAYVKMSEELFCYRADTGQSLLRDCVDVVKNYIEANLNGDVSLTRLAEVAHFNPKYLSRLFGERTGTNLSNYIAEKRLEKAKRLISGNAMKMQDIAAAVGFLTPSYFTRFFKKATGFTPQQYKEYFSTNKVDKG